MVFLSRLSRRVRPISGVCLVFLLLAFGPTSFASKSVPDEADFSLHEQRQFAIPEGKYLYQLEWNGIPSAETELLITLKDKETQPYYCFEGTARTSKFVDIFWKLRANVTAFVDALTGRTVKIDIRNQENGKLEHSETVFDHESSDAYYTKRKKGKVKQKTIHLPYGSLDPASLALMISQQKLRVGDSSSFTLLVGDNPYDVKYTVAAKECISVSGCQVDVLRIEPLFQKIAQDDKKKPRKVDLVTFWVTESEPHIPVKMQSKTIVGYVTAELVKVEIFEHFGEPSAT